MLFALTDETLVIERHHIEAALAWVRYWGDSVRFIFGDARGAEDAEEGVAICHQILGFLKDRTEADRTELHRDCFQNRLPKQKLDKALGDLLHATPPKIEVEKQPRKDGQPGRGRKVYRLLDVPTREFGEFSEGSASGEVCDVSSDCEVSEDSFSTVLNSQTS